MEPEETTPSKSKKFLKIALGVFATFFVLIGVAYFLTALKNAKQEPQPEVQSAPVVQKVLTQEEKMQILSDLTQPAPKDTTSQKDKVRILQNLAKQAPKSPEVSTADKLRILQDLATKTAQ